MWPVLPCLEKKALSSHTLVHFWKLCLFVIQFKCQLFDFLMFAFVPGPPVHFTNNVLCMNCTSALRVSVQQLLQLNCLIITFDLFSCLIIHFWFNRILIFVFFFLARWSSEWHLRFQSSVWMLNVVSLRHLHQKLFEETKRKRNRIFSHWMFILCLTVCGSGEAGLGSS